MVTLDDGSRIEDEIAVADAHPAGARPFGRAEYLHKLAVLCDGIVADEERERFVSAAEGLLELGPGALADLSIEADAGVLAGSLPRGIFDR